MMIVNKFFNFYKNVILGDFKFKQKRKLPNFVDFYYFFSDSYTFLFLA